MRILVIDDHPMCREALSELLRQRYPAGVLTVESSPDTALDVLGGEAQTLVVADRATCDAGGVSAEQLCHAAANAAVIVMDDRFDASAARRALAAGARGYIPKTHPRELVDAAIGLVAAGGLYLPQEGEADGGASGSGPPRRLSKRQSEVLDLLLQGCTNREIAAALGISLPTVKLHVQAILNATGARNRTEAALLARESRRASAV